jgi:hypothetical protein
LFFGGLLREGGGGRIGESRYPGDCGDRRPEFHTYA